MKYLCSIILSAMFLSACEKSLSTTEFAGVLADMYLYESVLGREVKVDSVSIYRSVFLKHDCTEEAFRRSMKKYASDPKKMKEVYAMVDGLLKAQKAVHDAAIKIKQEAQHADSLYRFPADTMSRHFQQRCAIALSPEY